ncbi:MAG: carbohydrate porin [Alphaproteobacteria bacterium]
MKKILLLLFFFSFSVQAAEGTSGNKNALKRQEAAEKRGLLRELEKGPQKYAEFKRWLNNQFGLSYTLDASFLPQRGAPSGSKTSTQTQYYGTITGRLFHSDLIGSGQATFAYTAVRYWGISGSNLASRIGVILPQNDYSSNGNYFNQLSYTHTLPGKMNWLSFTLGQFPMYDFDGGDYNANQQINFLNYALSQNGSSAYSTASLGGYFTAAFNQEWSFTAGAQNANNITGETISWNKFKKGKWTSFVAATYSPILWGLPGEYSLMLYHQPSTSAQPYNTRGWSLNLQQNITQKIALFGRINGATRTPETASQSYVLGAVYNNPFHRNSLDQIGLAAAINKLNRSVNGAGTRSWENVLEGYYAFGISNFMTLTPDVQFYLHPGANPNHSTATVLSLRATLMF